MFVQNIQIVQGPKYVIPSTVRIHHAKNEISNSRRGLLDFSAINCSYKFLTGIGKRELGEIIMVLKGA